MVKNLELKEVLALEDKSDYFRLLYQVDVLVGMADQYTRVSLHFMNGDLYFVPCSYFGSYTKHYPDFSKPYIDDYGQSLGFGKGDERYECDAWGVIKHLDLKPEFCIEIETDTWTPKEN